MYGVPYRADTSIKSLKSSIVEGSKLGSSKFYTFSSFTSNAAFGDEKDLERFEAEMGDSEDEDEANPTLTFSQVEDAETVITASDGRKLSSAVTKFCNGGRFKSKASARVKRFQAVGAKRLTLERPCQVAEGCKVFTVGHRGSFVRNHEGRKCAVRGQLIFVSVSSYSCYQSSPDRSSVSWDPVNSVCSEHQSFVAWVKEEGGSIVKCCNIRR